MPHTIYVANGGTATPGNTVPVINDLHCGSTNISGCGQAPASLTVGSLPIAVAVNQATHTPAAAAMAIDAAPIKGVLNLPVSALRVASIALRTPANRNLAISLTAEQFRYGFGNALPEQESADLARPAFPQQVHLDIRVRDIAAAEVRGARAGAAPLPSTEPGFRVYADPAGHPFCLEGG
jgi:Glyoxalase-like domain